MGHSRILVDFIRRARRRFIANQIYEQVTIALGAGFAGVILLLLFGTQILNWYWPVLLAVAGLGFGMYRLRGRIPSEYEAAQRIDRRLDLQDSLSTALFFLQHPDRGSAPADVRGLQFESAERTASRLSVTEAAPLTLPRSWYGALALALVACGMIGVRYGVNHTLDLQKPLAKFEFDTFRSRDEVAKAKQREQERKLDEQFKQTGLALDDEQQNMNRQMERPNESGKEAVDGEKGTETKTQTEKRKEQGLTSSDQEGPDQQQGAESQEGKEQPSNGDDQSVNTNQPGQKMDKQDSSQQQQAQSNQGENSSLMDKMRNAMANMLSKMKMQPQSGQGQQMASASKGSLQNGQQQQRAEQQGKESQNQQGNKQQGQPSADGKGNQEGQGDQQAQPGEGQQGSQASDKPSSQDSKTGMGKSDGNKDVKLAEQMEALGKISEIIGKRTQSLTGEMMVEVASGKQQLKTGYSQRNATHADSGGEIHRDEVPLALQQYVQQYFEEVRKNPLPKPVKAAAKGTTGKAASN